MLAAIGLLALGNSSDAILMRVAAVLTADGFAQTNPVSDRAADMPFLMDVVFTSESRGLAVRIHGGSPATPSEKEGAIRDWGNFGATPTPLGSLSGITLGEKCAHDWNRLGGFQRALVDRYSLEVHVYVPRGREPLSEPAQDSLARSLCERITRLVLADAMAIDLGDDGRELGTSHLTGNEAPKDGYVTLDAWAARARATVAHDAKTASATVTANGKSVRLLLAADKAIVNGVETGLGGKYVLARGARWFVPDRELTALVR